VECADVPGVAGALVALTRAVSAAINGKLTV
jgi:hypothetical protein